MKVLKKIKRSIRQSKAGNQRVNRVNQHVNQHVNQQQHSTPTSVSDVLLESLPTEMTSIILDYAADTGVEGVHVGQLVSFDTQSKLIYPQGMTCNDTNIFVCAMAEFCVQVYTLDGAFVRKFGSQGTGDGEFQYPYLVEYSPKTNFLSSSDKLFVSDISNNCIQVFTTEGVFKRKWYLGFEPGGFALWGSECFVANPRRNQIHVYSKRGQPLRNWFCNALDSPYGLCVQDNTLYVCNGSNHRVEVFSEYGKWLGSLEEPKSEDDTSAGRWVPRRVTVSGDIVYVGDGVGRIHVFMRSGEFLRTLRRKSGTDEGEHGGGEVTGLIARDGRLFVSDFYNHRIQMFE